MKLEINNLIYELGKGRKFGQKLVNNLSELSKLEPSLVKTIFGMI